MLTVEFFGSALGLFGVIVGLLGVIVILRVVRKPVSFVRMLTEEIFGSTLGLFGVIVGPFALIVILRAVQKMCTEKCFRASACVISVSSVVSHGRFSSRRCTVMQQRLV